MFPKILYILILLCDVHGSQTSFMSQYKSCLGEVCQYSRMKKPVVCSVFYCGDNDYFEYGHRLIVNSLIRSGIYVFTPTDFLPSSSFPQHRQEVNLLTAKSCENFNSHVGFLLQKTDFVIPILGHSFKRDLPKAVQSFPSNKVLGFFLSPKSSLSANEHCEGKWFYHCYGEYKSFERILGLSVMDLLGKCLDKSNPAINIIDQFVTPYKSMVRGSYYSYSEHFSGFPLGTIEKDLWYNIDIEGRKCLVELFKCASSKEIFGVGE